MQFQIFKPHKDKISSAFFLEPPSDSRICKMTQVHKNDVIRFIETNKHEHFEADASITNQKNIMLEIRVADCQAIQVYDPVEHEIANIHAGWRSLTQHIIPNVLSEMRGNPRDFLVGFFPSLGPCCSEFSDPKNELPDDFHTYIFKPDCSCEKGCVCKVHVDLNKAAEDEFLQAGVLSHNIERIQLCTKCTKSPSGEYEFYSWRRGGNGRMYSMITLL